MVLFTSIVFIFMTLLCKFIVSIRVAIEDEII